MKRTISIIVAATKEHGGIGVENRLPWRLPGDMKYFKDVTSTTKDMHKQNAVIMGRKTWDSIPTKFRPLASRMNIILTKNESIKENIGMGEGVFVASSIQEALDLVSEKSAIENVFIIGGASIYKQALDLNVVDRIYLTQINQSFACDTFFQFDQSQFKQSSSSGPKGEKSIDYEFLVFDKQNSLTQKSTKPHEENQYLDLIQKIIDEGVQRGDRTGTGTLSIFGAQMRFNLREDVFPLLTTKKVFWRGVAEELLWFISGDTNAATLKEKNIHIWDGNGSKEYLDSIGLSHREEGDLGPVYGFQWRHFGAKYVDMHTDYTGQGIDQLAQVIDKIKNKPNDRRILLSAWNPADLGEMALPPCHMFCQFYVANGELSCQMYQRSADMGLGVPFNIASYALLTRLIAQVCGLKAGEFVHVIGDAHIYLDHVEPLKEQLKRTPLEFPKLWVNPEKTDIDSFSMNDFRLEGYKSHKSIKMKMSV